MLTGYLLTQEERMLQQTVRDFAQHELAPRAAEVDGGDGTFCWDYFHGMAKLGLLGMTIPVEVGGSGGSYKQLAIVIEELTRGDPSASLIYVAHLSLTTATLDRFGTDGQRQLFVPPLAQGKKVGSWCLTEPSSGSDAANFETRLRRQNGNYILNGNKTFISNGDVADTFVVFTTLEGSPRHQGTVAIVVERDGTRGLETTEQKGKMGMHGSSTASVNFQDCVVSEENRLGEETDGFKIAMSILDSSRIGIGAQAVGIAAESLDLASRYAKQRSAFGQPIANFQGLQWMIADMAVEVDAARLLTYRAAELKDAGVSHGTESAMAKLYASEVAMRTTSKAVQIHGGYGYFRPHPVERLFRDAKVTEIYEGTSEIQRIVIARNILRNINT